MSLTVFLDGTLSLSRPVSLLDSQAETTRKGGASITLLLFRREASLSLWAFFVVAVIQVEMTPHLRGF